MEGLPHTPSVAVARNGVGRNILIADTDIFRSIGGGQTVYKRIISLLPQDRFYYFRRFESADAPRPVNAFPISLNTFYQAVPEKSSPSHKRLLWSYRDCRNMAASVASVLPGFAFDVVDVPDYTQHGVFIRAALQAEGLSCGTVAVSMHGTLSAAWRRGWSTGGLRGLTEGLEEREALQFGAADVRYAISERYAKHWQKTSPLPVRMLDPRCVIGEVTPSLPSAAAEQPNLVYIGRREKWKGPDLFLDIAWCTDASAYKRLVLAGPDGPNAVGLGSDDILRSMARLRRLDFQMPGALSRQDVQRVFDERNLILLPSRYDTFNLLALEAVMNGCPAIVSGNAGIAEWFQKELPDLSWLVVGLDCSRSAADAVSDVLHHYDERRRELYDAVSALPPPDLEGLSRIYEPTGDVDLDARQTSVELAAHFRDLARLRESSLKQRVVRHSVQAVRRLGASSLGLMPSPLRHRVKRIGTAVKAIHRFRRYGGLHSGAKAQLKELAYSLSGLSARTIVQIYHSHRREMVRRELLAEPAGGRGAAQHKLSVASSRVANGLVNRIPLFREMARLERRLDRDLVAATYLLRVMRWLGDDLYGDLPFTAATLRASGFVHEADVAEAMFGPATLREERCYGLMQEAYQRNLKKPELPLAVLDDRRGGGTPRVAVIVSLYNAASKLPTLLANLAQQSLAKRGELEIVLVDSNSPADEHGAMEAFLARQPVPIVYARSAQRETIQMAWNRGIRLARAPYLAFLGADEGLHPDALRQLAAALDADPGIDWAMADSLVTNVDASGIYDSDIMPYDRTGYRQDLVYLDTCYLSWVGGLYRRSIHDRFGYYDETYRAAGDTEFKNRIMPHIRSVHVPGMLGIFNNYPEERTTQHPRAEIEDLRAWYLWRSVAGMRYAFGNRPVEDAIALLRTALNYRKSFCGHLSTDFDLADALARYVATRPDCPAWALQAQHETAKALAKIHAVELLPQRLIHGPRGLNTGRFVLSQVRRARDEMAERHRQIFDLPGKPHYELFNDNRYEQHWWSWSEET